MIIQIGQDDGVLHGGIPKLVVLTITEGDTQVSFPFQADQPISAIYFAAQKALKNNSPSLAHIPESFSLTVSTGKESQTTVTSSVIKGKIQKRDIIKYIGSPSEEGTDLKPGHIYRVLDVKKDTYEIIDDASPTPIRLVILKSDAELFEKAKPLHVIKKQVFELSEKCEKCGLDIILVKEKDGVYRGVCDDVCGHKQEKRIEKPGA